MKKFICDGKIIRDEFGRHRIFRGINIVIKGRYMSCERFRSEFCCDKFFNMLKSNGFNIIRLGLVWDLIEQNEGEYTTDYINAIKEFTKICGKNDIYVMLDMHQDLFSHYLGGGDGAPLWAVEGHTLNQKPVAIWAEGYFYMDNVQESFNDFWNNKNNLQDKYVDMWRFFASQFDDCDNVIAYDYMNEPYVDKDGRKIFLTVIKRVLKQTLNIDIEPEKYFSQYSNKKAFVKSVLSIASKVVTVKRLKRIESSLDDSDNFGRVVSGLEKYTIDFNKNYYEPFIKNISEKVNLNQNKFNVIEHNYYSNLGIPFEVETPCNCLYSPHAYDVFVDSPLYNKYSSNERIKYITTMIRQNQDKMNLPVLFGEWGAGANGNEWVKHIDYIIGVMEDNLWSNIYWAYDDKKLHDTMNRPYPVAFNGTIMRIKSDSKDRTFIVEWEQNKDCVKPNILYMPNEGLVEIEGKLGKNTYKVEY